MMFRTSARRATLAVALTCSTFSALAAWPDKPIWLVVPYGPGGGVDSFSRPLAAKLSGLLGQSVVVENKPGAGGTIGVQRVHSAPADGNFILSGGVHQPMAEGLYRHRGYDMEKDFVPIALTARVPNALVLTKKAPFNTVKELIAYAKEHPGKINYCSSGNGTSQHVVGEIFAKLAGISMTHIPYRGTAAAMTDLIGGQCDLMLDGMGTSAPQIRAGTIKILAVTTEQRSKAFPDVPTMSEAGGPSMDASIWYAVWVRTGTPPEIIKRLRNDVRSALADPTVLEAWSSQAAEVPRASSDAELEAYVRSETVRWKKAVQDLGLRID